MSGYLVIVESPAKAKTIGRILGKKYKVEASVGHLRDLPVSKLAIDIEHDFKPQYMNIRGKGDLIKALKKDAKEADRVFLATDPDQMCIRDRGKLLRLKQEYFFTSAGVQSILRRMKQNGVSPSELHRYAAIHINAVSYTHLIHWMSTNGAAG